MAPQSLTAIGSKRGVEPKRGEPPRCTGMGSGSTVGLVASDDDTNRSDASRKSRSRHSHRRTCSRLPSCVRSLQSAKARDRSLGSGSFRMESAGPPRSCGAILQSACHNQHTCTRILACFSPTGGGWHHSTAVSTLGQDSGTATRRQPRPRIVTMRSPTAVGSPMATNRPTDGSSRWPGWRARRKLTA